MSNIDILSITPDYLLYEQLIKSLCEPLVIKIVKEANETLDQIQNWHLISRGGDALNFYYTSTNFIPTHDWDLGIVRIPNLDELNQADFDNLIGFIDNLGQNLKEQLNVFINQNLKNVKVGDVSIITGLKFDYIRSGARLSNVIFNYTLNNVSRINSMIDLYILGNFSDDVTHDSDPFDNKQSNYEKKYDSSSLNNLLKDFGGNRELLINFLKQERLTRNTLFKNTLNLIVQDSKSSMKYVAPGDLLNDTIRMIYQSYLDIEISSSNNKLDKYILKYSTLLDEINKMINLCPNNSCEIVTSEIISRKTDDKDCKENIIQNRSDWDIDMANYFQKWYNNFNNFELLSSQKLCQMKTILEYSENKFNLIFP